jgi:hypothetical protein
VAGTGGITKNLNSEKDAPKLYEKPRQSKEKPKAVANEACTSAPSHPEENLQDNGFDIFKPDP